MKGWLRKPYLAVALWVIGCSLGPGLPIWRPTADPTPRAAVWRPYAPPSLRRWLLPDPMGLESPSTPVYASNHPRHMA